MANHDPSYWRKFQAVIDSTGQVFWEGDGAWYRGSVVGYSAATRRHTILYDDNDLERVILDAVPHRSRSLCPHSTFVLPSIGSLLV